MNVFSLVYTTCYSVFEKWSTQWDSVRKWKLLVQNYSDLWVQGMYSRDIYRLWLRPQNCLQRSSSDVIAERRDIQRTVYYDVILYQNGFNLILCLCKFVQLALRFLFLADFSDPSTWAVFKFKVSVVSHRIPPRSIHLCTSPSAPGSVHRGSSLLL